MAVQDILSKLNISYLDVRLGEIVLGDTLKEEQCLKLRSELEKVGFELLDNNQKQIIERIKSIIIQQVHYAQSIQQPYILSEILSSELNREYSYLSKLFSTTEGVTIEHYVILQKVEKVKELLSYDHQTLSEIAIDLGYSSVAHLSSQFKKITGLTTSQFRAQGISLRKGLDQIN